MFKLAHFKSIAEQAPAFDSDWIFVDVEFCREGYDQSLKSTFAGTLPYGLKMDFTASDYIALLGQPVVNDYYEAPGFHYKVLAWTKGNRYIGIAFENASEEARINCLGVSLVGTGVGWGVDWN